MSGCRANRVLFIGAKTTVADAALSHCRRTIYRTRPGGASPSPTQNLAYSESRQDIIRVARLTRKRGCILSRRSGRHPASAPSSTSGKTLCPMRSQNDLQAGTRLLVCGTAACSYACRRRRMPVPQLSASQDRSVTKSRQKKRSLNRQSIWTAGPPVVPATATKRATTARATL